MVKLCHDELQSNIGQLHGKRVFCFGGGRIFRDIFPSLVALNVEGVIDNYLSQDQEEILIDTVSVPFVSFDRYVQISKPGDVLIITSRYYKEIVEQLDGENGLEGIKCFLASRPSEDELDEYIKCRGAKHALNPGSKGNSDGHHFQIWEYIDDNMHAGSKAPKDVRTILENVGYKTLNVHMELCTSEESSEDESAWRNKRSMEEWLHCVDTVPCGATMVIQNPFRLENIYREKAILELKRKNVKIVSIVHDIESIRGLNSPGYFVREEEFMMSTSDVVVVQNRKMRDYLEVRWPGKGRIIELKIFDYLADGPDTGEKLFNGTINFAGSLEFRKSPFLYKLGELADVKISLYGPDFEIDRFEGGIIPENISYEGAYPSGKMPEILKQGFGLVWEGEELDTCDKGTGRYLTMNSPHKLSLYLASGLPVIIWDKAAMAGFVLENEVGITVSSLYRLRETLDVVTEDAYENYAANAKKIGQKLRNGEYTMNAIKGAEIELER